MYCIFHISISSPSIWLGNMKKLKCAQGVKSKENLRSMVFFVLLGQCSKKISALVLVLSKGTGILH